MTHDEVRAVVRHVLDQLSVEGSDFYHNVPNDYGVITGKLFVGQGNPWLKYRGAALVARYGEEGVERESGYYKLNDALVDKIAADFAAHDGSAMTLPPKWRIDDISRAPFRGYVVQAPTGEAATAHSHERNPGNVLFMLADALYKAKAK